MQTTFALAALAATAFAAPQALQARAPAGCAENYNGKFQVTAVNVTSAAAKRSLAERAVTCEDPSSLTITLANGVLTDSRGSQGSVVANYQFQFDPPNLLQPGSIATSGFGVCSNGTLAHPDSAVFYQCLSGEFYNLYDRSIGEQCNAIYLQVLPCGGAAAAPPVAQQGDGQPTGPVGQGPVTQIGDGQVQGGAPITELADGQPQVPTGVPVTQIGDGQVQAPTGVPVTQIGDGQVQAPTGAPVTQIGDGQVQAPTATGAPVTQIGDGQVQAPTGAPVTQIGDGQVQAPTGAPVTQIADGQVQAPTATGAPVTQIPDGQVQAPTNATSPVAFTGASNTLKASTFGAIVAGLTALFL